MKLNATTLLCAFAVALAAYTAWDYQKAQQSVGMGENEKRLFTIAPLDVEKIKLTRPGEVLVLEKQNGEWQMLEPVQDAAMGSAVDALIYSLVIQKGRVFRTEDGNQNPSLTEFGLDNPAAVVEISNKDRLDRLTVSNKNAFDGSYYISQGDAVYLGDPGLAQVVGKDAMMLRSRKMWRDGDLDIDSLEVSLPPLKEKYTVKRKGDGWVIEPTPPFKVDSERVQHWIYDLQDLSATSLVVDSASGDEKAKAQLNKPSFIVLAKFKKLDGMPSEWTFTTGPQIGQGIFGVSSARDAIYSFSRGGLKNVRVPQEYFRDGRSAFQFPLEKAAEIEIRQGSFHHNFKKDGSDWKVAGADAQKYTLNQEKLVEMMQAISRIEAQEFLPTKEAKGFKDHEGIVVRDNQGADLFKLTWGADYPGKQSYNEGMTLRAVKTNLEGDVMGVHAEKFKALVDPALVTEKEQKK